MDRKLLHGILMILLQVSASAQSQLKIHAERWMSDDNGPKDHQEQTWVVESRPNVGQRSRSVLGDGLLTGQLLSLQGTV